MHAHFPRWIAHRGAGTLAPENTLAAFRAGAALGHLAFECDVKLSADGVPFLLHDSTLERTTSATGTAGDLSWAALSRVDAGSWHSRPYAGEPLPTLDAIAAFVVRNGYALNLEIKPTPGHEAATGHAVAQAALRWWAAGAPAAPPLVLSSFEPQALYAAQAAAPQLQRALLIDEPWAGWPGVAAALGAVAIVANHHIVDDAFAAQVHAGGHALWCYTVNDAASADRLLALGARSIITDAVDSFGP